MYCRECGADLREGTNFCPECGSPVGDGDETGSRDDPAVEGASATGGAETPAGSGDAGPSAGSRDPETPADAGSGGLRYGDGREDRSATVDGDRRRSREGYPDATPPVVGGAIAGAVAYLASYAVVYGLYLVETGVGESSLRAYLGTSVAEPTVVGWLFYGAHNVPVGAGTGSGTSLNVLQAVGLSTLPRPVFYAVGPLVLVLGGFAFGRLILARRRDERGWVTPGDGAVAGTTLAVGYVLLAGAGAVVGFTHAGDGGTTAPSLTLSVVAMGLAYPLAFGTLGGALSGL